MKYLFILALWLFCASSAYPAEYELRIVNPERDIGYIVGDKLTRTIEIDAAAPYTLAPASLPAKGVSRHGIELRDISVTHSTAGGRTPDTLQLTYQVFTSADHVKKVELPQERLYLTGEGRKLEVLIPSWNFRVSPLAAYGETRLDEDMSPYRPPLQLDETLNLRLLWGFLVLIATSGVALLYFNGDRRWLPGMGGHFAKACRKLRRLPDEAASTPAAVMAIHEAFNATFGANLFEADLDSFFRQHPRFAAIRSDVEEFFRLSNRVLFDSAQHPGMGTLFLLRYFCRQCRDCEREPFNFKPLTAITLCSVVLTGFVILLMQNIPMLPVWPLVIAWACFFHLGGGNEPRGAIVSVLVSTIFGVAMGWLSALAILNNPITDFVSPGIWAALVIAVFVGAISACAYWRPLSITPVCIYGYAATWGYLDVPGRFDPTALTTLNTHNVILILPTAIALGCALGYLNAKMVGMLMVKPQTP